LILVIFLCLVFLKARQVTEFLFASDEGAGEEVYSILLLIKMFSVRDVSLPFVREWLCAESNCIASETYAGKAHIRKRATHRYAS